MTEEQIGTAVRDKLNWLDLRFMATPMTQAEYDAESDAINTWADNECRNTPPLAGSPTLRGVASCGLDGECRNFEKPRQPAESFPACAAGTPFLESSRKCARHL